MEPPPIVSQPPALIDSPPAIVAKLDAAEAEPTPYAEVTRVLALLPKPAVGFVDYGCGADARWCIAAAELWGCKATGVEIDPYRAKAARERVRAAGLGHLITIIEGDATTTDVQADVGVAYLYEDTLKKLRPRIEKLRAFASYLHQPPGVTVTQNGDTWFYTQPPPVVQVARSAVAVWGGQVYSGPVCNNPRCGMCNAIRAQLATSVVQAAPATQQPAKAATGRYVKHCSNGVCWYEWVPD